VDVDDNSIEDNSRLLRRIPLVVGGTYPQIVWDENSNAWVPSSLAFNGHPDDPRAFSVHLESVLIAAGQTPDAVILDPAKFAITSITAGQARSQRQVIQRKPLADEPAHAHVVGDKTNSVRKALKRFAVWVIPPPADLAHGP
jgi:hypothetical protein